MLNEFNRLKKENHKDYEFFTYNTFKNFLVSASFDYSFPAGTSYMYDSDWDDGIKYSYTTHPLKASKEINTQLLIAYRLYSDYIL